MSKSTIRTRIAKVAAVTTITSVAALGMAAPAQAGGHGGNSSKDCNSGALGQLINLQLTCSNVLSDNKVNVLNDVNVLNIGNGAIL